MSGAVVRKAVVLGTAAVVFAIALLSLRRCRLIVGMVLGGLGAGGKGKEKRGRRGKAEMLKAETGGIANRQSPIVN